MLPKQHPLAQLTEIPVGQLNGLSITVLSQKLSQPLFDTITQYIEKRQIQFQTISEANSIADLVRSILCCFSFQSRQRMAIQLENSHAGPELN